MTLMAGGRKLWCAAPPVFAAVAVTLLLLAALFLSPRVADAAEQPLEYQVKAAFLLNFTKFIEWPAETASTASPVDICILGDDPFGPVLDQMVAGETLQGRKIEVVRVKRPPPSSCLVLFIGRSEKDVDSLLSMLGPGVLTVSEKTNFLHDGGIIEFAVENHKVKFDINQTAAAKARLQISSKLLNIARSVEK
jgi:YfiR/HmsC-like